MSYGKCDRCALRVAVDRAGLTGPADTAIGRFEVHRPHDNRVTVENLCREHVHGMRGYGFRLDQQVTA